MRAGAAGAAMALATLLAAAPGAEGRQPGIRVEGARTVAPGDPWPTVEPHLVAAGPDGDVLVAAAIAVPDPLGEPRIRIYSSSDGGSRWEGRWLPGSEEGPEVGHGVDPALAPGPGRTVYLTHLPDQLWRSTDGGRTWEGPARLPARAGPADYGKVAVDRTGGPRHGRLYLAAAVGEGAALFRSLDGGRSLRGPVPYHPGPGRHQNGEVVVLPDGVVVSTVQELDPGPGGRYGLWSAASRDGGETFQEPRLVVRGPRTSPPGLAVDRSGDLRRGRLYAAWNELEGARAGRVAFSDDGGATWSEPRTFMVRGGGEGRLTAVAAAVTRDGTVALAWQEPDPTAGEGCYRLLITASVDGGASWAEAEPVSPEPGCAPPDDATPGLTRRYPSGGDYLGLAATGARTFRAVWSDARTGVFGLRTARIRVE